MSQSNIKASSKHGWLLKLLKWLGVLVFWVGVWFALALKTNNAFLFPSPTEVLSVLGELVLTAEFWSISMASLCRVFLGVALSVLIGVALAIAISYSVVLNALASPMLTVIKSTPVASFIILVCIWMDTSFLPVFITSLIVIPIVCSNISQGISSVDKSLLEVAKIYKFSLPKKIYRLYIPSLAPYFLAACKSSLGMAWKAGIAAEVLAPPKNAIGSQLYFAKTYYETSTMFAWTLVIILLSMIFEKLLVGLIELIGKRLHVMPKGGDTNAQG